MSATAAKKQKPLKRLSLIHISLEEELGTPLFTRTTCRVEPTEAGQLFAAFAQNLSLIHI